MSDKAMMVDLNSGRPFGCECGQWYATPAAATQCFLSHYTKEKGAYLLAACDAGFTMKQAKFLWENPRD